MNKVLITGGLGFEKTIDCYLSGEVWLESMISGTYKQYVSISK